MNSKILNKRICTKLVLVIVFGGALGNVVAQENNSGLFSSPFDNCFASGYNISLVTQDQAYTTAKCFTSLLEKEDVDLSLGASKHTILEYAASWYQAAATKGHTLAQTHLNTSINALNLFEQQKYFGIEEQNQYLLASEKKFQMLDTDNNGVLSLAEASSSPSLESAFLKSDIDKDGLLNFGEYTILFGEATAAGN